MGENNNELRGDSWYLAAPIFNWGHRARSQNSTKEIPVTKSITGSEEPGPRRWEGRDRPPRTLPSGGCGAPRGMGPAVQLLPCNQRTRPGVAGGGRRCQHPNRGGTRESRSSEHSPPSPPLPYLAGFVKLLLKPRHGHPSAAGGSPRSAYPEAAAGGWRLRAAIRGLSLCHPHRRPRRPARVETSRSERAQRYHPIGRRSCPCKWHSRSRPPIGRAWGTMQIERSKTPTLRCCAKTAGPAGSARTALPGGRSAARLSHAGFGCLLGPAMACFPLRTSHCYAAS